MADVRGINFGAQLWDARLDSGKLTSDQTVMGFDIALVRVDGLLGTFRQGEVFLQERATVEGIEKPSPQAVAALERMLGRRRKEFDEFLKLGKTIVVFLARPEEYVVPRGIEKQTDDRGNERSVEMHERRTTVTQLLPVKASVEALFGHALRLTTTGAFAEFWAEWGELFHHEAVLTSHPGVTTVQVADTNRAVAAIVEHGPGLLLLLPDFVDFDYSPQLRDAAPEFVDALVALSGRLSSEVDLPDWATAVELPNEPAARRRLAAAESKVEHWRNEIKTRADDMRAIERRKALLTATGTPLEMLAEEAFRALGFQVEASEYAREDRVLRLGERIAVVEIKGQKGSAKEQDAAQLNKWVSAYRADHGVQPKGVLVVNAFNQTPLIERRKAAFPHQMLRYAVEQQAFCLLTSEQLLALWLRVDFGEPGEALAASLLDCAGVYPGAGLRALGKHAQSDGAAA